MKISGCNREVAALKWYVIYLVSTKWLQYLSLRLAALHSDLTTTVKELNTYVLLAVMHKCCTNDVHVHYLYEGDSKKPFFTHTKEQCIQNKSWIYTL